MGIKRIGGSMLYMRGARATSKAGGFKRSSTALKSIPADRLVLDERDEMASDMVDLARERKDRRSGLRWLPGEDRRGSKGERQRQQYRYPNPSFTHGFTCTTSRPFHPEDTSRPTEGYAAQGEIAKGWHSLVVPAAISSCEGPPSAGLAWPSSPSCAASSARADPCPRGVPPPSPRSP